MSDKITFKQLVELIAKQSKQSESSANSFIHELVQIIESGLKDSGSVSISGFGKFELRWMKERSGVNPQTGDEITIPGQNKVVFKPYKALRETVNKPFANLEPEILKEKNDTEESSTADEQSEEDSEGSFGLDDVLDSEAPGQSDLTDDDSKDPFDIDSDVDYDADDPFGFDKKSKESSISQDYNQYIDDLIFEKENPHFGGSKTQPASSSDANAYAYNSEDDDVLVLDEDQDDEQSPKVAPPIPDESKMAEKVQESGSYKWSYAAAVIIVMVALILLFWMMQRSGDGIEETASTSGTPNQEQTEQVLDQSTSESDAADEAATNQESVAESETAESESTVNEEPTSTAAVDRQAQNNIETQSFTVESGQSLWDIAESELGNPYLWPVIYQLNQDVLNNPNQIIASSNIEIPTFSDPDNLSEFEREQVALGYFSLYQWNRENNPDEARYFLWAVGVFSQDLLDQPPSEVDSQDLAFARNR